MDARILNLKAVKDCENFEKNAVRLGYADLATEARMRALQINAEKYRAETEAEKEALEAVFAYERVLSAKAGKRRRASRTWQMIERHGIIEAIERAVNRPDETMGYTMLLDMGLERHAFEAVILRHPQHFSEEAISVSTGRIKDWTKIN